MHFQKIDIFNGARVKETDPHSQKYAAKWL